MNGFLKQSTAGQSRLTFPFVDSTDFKTVKTGLTIANTDVQLRVNGVTGTTKNSGGATHQANGQYSLAWDATDTATVGELAYSILVAGALVNSGSYVVLTGAVYDLFFGATAAGPATPAQVWDVLTSTLTAVGSIGKRLVDDVDATVSSRAAEAGGKIDAIKLKTDALPSGVQKNTALNNFEFLMIDAADHISPKTGLTVAAQRSIDGAGFADCANAVAEVGAGIYKINLATTDLNGDVITLKFTATGADQRAVTVITEP